ncbi:hypothetical protein IAD21_06154 [Abditibacteriota bacterium]|nr:hypothetical protein IAD21_06154 [Abditibacteriota bacterium]
MSKIGFPLPLLFMAGVCLMALQCAQAQNDKPRVIKTQFPTDDYVVASVVVTQAPYSAKADGSSDCTVVVQSAIDATAKQGGGIVFLPAGRYRFDGDLVLKEGVTLRGDWKAPGITATVGGTVLMPYAHRGQSEAAPFISMYRGTGVRNLSIWYPEQNAQNPTPYPWTLADDQQHTGNNFTIHQVTLVNPYQGIKFGPQYNELFTVRQVYGTPLKTGLQFDSVTDIGRILNVSFGLRYWTQSGLGQKPDAAALGRYLIQNGTAFEMRRSDWQYFYDVAVQGYARGLYIRRGAYGGSIGVATNFRATDCDVGLYVEETRFVAVNSTFQGRSSAVVTTPEFNDDLQLNNCQLSSTNGPAVKHQGLGALRIINSRLTGSGSSLLAAQGQVTLMNCDVPGKGVQVSISRPVQRALLIGNRFGEPARALKSASRGDIQLDNKPLNSPRVAIPTIPITPDRRPATDKLFNVLDYGAQIGKSDTTFDNTTAFQNALDAAGKAHGGTVWVPGGFYRLNGHLKVPTGVELRGVFDVPHHTISVGSVLMPTEGRDNEKGAPFINLSTGSGLRGLTIWYPEQFVDEIAPYPWTVRSLGPKCWMMDVTSANSYNYIDFGTNPSEGHLLRYVAGSPLRRGLWVSKGSGVVDSCQFNPHYWVRRSDVEPPLSHTPKANLGDTLINYVFKNHQAFVFGHCPQEVQTNNFVYGANYGLRFVYDGGASSGWIINHATDGASEGVTVDAAGSGGLNIVSTQIAVVGEFKRRAVFVGPKNHGPVNIWGGYSFGQSDVPTMELYGTGPTLVQSWQSKQSEIVASGGPKRIESNAFTLSLPESVKLKGAVSKLTLIGNTAPTDVGFAYAPPQKTVASRSNGRTLPPIPLTVRFSTHFAATDPQTTIKPITIKDIANPQCRVENGAGRKGAAIVLSGQPDAAAQALAYYAIYDDVNLEVKPTTMLRYYWRGDTPSSTHTGVDLIFTDGTTLRDSGVVDTSGNNMHPAAGKNAPGHWWKIEGNIGQKLAGKTIKTILFAFDLTGAKTPVTAAVDSIEIGEPKP